MSQISAQLDSPQEVARPISHRHRRLRMFLLVMLGVSLFGTGVSVVSFLLPGAVVAAFFVVVFYSLLVAVKFVDRHEWAHRLLTDKDLPPAPQADLDGEEIARVEIEPDVPPAVVAAERAGFRLGLVIAAPLGVLALLLAAIIFINDPAIIGLGAIAIFAFMIFMGLPVWLAAAGDEIEEAEERDGIQHPPSIR